MEKDEFSEKAYFWSRPERDKTTGSIPDIQFRYDGPAVGGVELIDLSKFKQRTCTYRNSPGKPHRIFFHCFFFPSYAGTHEIDFQSFDFKPGEIIYVGPKQVHAWNFECSLTGSCLLVGADLMNRITPLLPSHQLFGLRRSNPSRCEPSQRQLIDQILTLLKNELSVKVSAQAIELLVAHLLRLINPEQNEHPVPKELEQFRKFCELVEAHAAQTRNVGFYADKLNMTPETLNRLVRKLSETSAKRWIDRCVALLAQRRLVSEEISVDTLSYEMGFSQTTHFIKFFFRLVGVTPGNFQRGQRQCVGFDEKEMRRKLKLPPGRADGRSDK